MTLAALAALGVRCLLVVLFLPFSALDKVLNHKGAVAQARQMFPRPVAVALIALGLCLEVFGSLAVVTGVADRAAAFLLAAYCVVTALLWKRFWAQGDFWRDPQGKGRSLFWDFLKNGSLAGGFLLVVVGTDGAGLAPFLHHPLASSRPYPWSPR